MAARDPLQSLTARRHRLPRENTQRWNVLEREGSWRTVIDALTD